MIVIGGLVFFEDQARRTTASYKINLTNGEATNISADVIFSDGVAAAQLGDIIYMSGGSALVSHAIGNGAYSTGFNDTFAAYDVANDSWRRLQDLPTTVTNHCSFASDGSVYIVGGQQERSMRPFRSPYITATRILQFSIANNRWSSIEAPPGVLTQGAACARLGDEYFLIGGHRGGPAVKDVWVWNFARNTWRRAPDLPDAASGAEAILHDGAIYVAGGAIYRDVDGVASSVDERSMWRLQSSAEAWEVVGEISVPRAGHTMISWNDGIFLIGGTALGGPRPPGLWIERVH